jgi:hypothetical protein
MLMTASEAFTRSADADVYLTINGQDARIINGMRHSAGIAMSVEYADGSCGRVDCSADLPVTVARIHG